MNYEKTVLCLANSRKPPSGRCVAGRTINGQSFGEWIRPISDRPGHEISEEERRFDSGQRAQVLDVIAIPMIEPRPMRYQTENHLIDAEYYWKKLRGATWGEVLSAAETLNGPLWVNGHSTFHGRNDKVPEQYVSDLKNSLVLLRVPKLILRVVVESGFEGRPGKKRSRAVFNHLGHPYSLSMTDPVFEDEYLVKPVGDYPIDNAVLTLSLSELFYDHAFKLAAAVITEERCGA